MPRCSRGTYFSLARKTSIDARLIIWAHRERGLRAGSYEQLLNLEAGWKPAPGEDLTDWT